MSRAGIDLGVVMKLDLISFYAHGTTMDGFFFSFSAMGAVLVAMFLDALFGEPKILWRRAGHPIVWLGKFAERIETVFNKGDQRIVRGAFSWLRVVSTATLIGFLLQIVCSWFAYGWIVVGFIGSIGLAARSLDQHVRAVADGLDQTIEEGRNAVSKIVGRDPESLDQDGIARAAIESLAENSSDGFVAPIFWFALFGLPGLFAYKSINTLDSMWGHRNPEFEKFGKVSARVDDVVNWLPARLTAFWVSFVMGTFSPLAAAFRDGPKHRSINAGWPEAAFACALGLSLAGPRAYGGEIVNDAEMGTGSRNASSSHIRAALRIFWFLWGAAAMTCCLLFLLGLLV